MAAIDSPEVPDQPGAWRGHLLWEVRWSAIEAACVGVGLWLLPFGGAFAGIWLMLLVLDFCFRFRHYAGLAGPAGARQ